MTESQQHFGYAILAALVFLLIFWWCQRHDRRQAQHRLNLQAAGLRTSVPIHHIPHLDAFPAFAAVGTIYFVEDRREYWKYAGLSDNGTRQCFRQITPGPEHLPTH